MIALTIISIHLNDFPGLQRTWRSMASVLKEKAVQWIVVDGGSDLEKVDTAVWERIRASASQFISEPDEGIYDAMNKGVRQASGEYLLFLNAGDELQEEFEFSQFADIIAVSLPAMIWGQCLVQYENGSRVRVKSRSPSWAWYGMPAGHQAIFFRRDALGESPYDTTWRIGADYDLVCRLVRSGERVEVSDMPVAIFHRGGLSDISDEALAEEDLIRRKHYSIPVFVGKAIMMTRSASARLAERVWLRRLWRKWI